LKIFSKENKNFKKRNVLNKIIGISFSLFFLKKFIKSYQSDLIREKKTIFILNKLDSVLITINGNKNRFNDIINEAKQNIFNEEEFYYLRENHEILENLIQHF